MDYIVTNRESEYPQNYDFCSVDECLEFLNKVPSIGYDTETTSLSFANGVIRAMLFSDGENNFIVDIESEIEPTLFKEVLETKELIVQDGQFDLCFLYAHKIIPEKLWDTRLAELSLSLGIINWERDLGALVKSYLDIDIDKTLQKKIHEYPLTSVEAITYMFNDVRYLHRLKEEMIPVLKKYEVVGAHKLHCRFSRVAAYIEFSGVKQHKVRLEKLFREYEAKEWFEEDRLNKWLSENTAIDPMEFNWNSEKQVGVLLKNLGYNIYDSKEKKESVNIKMLSDRYKDDEFIRQYIEFREKNKMVTTYGRAWATYPMEDGLIHSKLRGVGTETGRTASGDKRNGNFPNLQNIPKGSAFRKTFIPHKATHVFIDLDYSQQEAVIMADFSKDEKMLEFFKEDGADFHSYNAREVWHDELGHLSLQEIKDKFPEKRQLAKALGFTLNFGGGAFAFAASAKIPATEATTIIDSYFSRFSGLKEYKDRVTQEALDRGYILINKVTGGKRFIKDYKWYKKNKYDNRNVEKFERMVEKAALNTPIQGTAADISKTAGILFFEWIIKNKRFGKTFIPLMIHDEYVISETKARAEATAQVMVDCMVKAGSYFLQDIQLKVDYKISDFWEH